ncbi:hypothetical protein M406DRAFT_97590 [Cryphonectria parasitica EP155]|uniref:Uncharacterized protein n=1 Tax=Cryphonectria parasitica (strain ATCC 38755 / EP155) TaxID=660469 RepID=A0A9P4Y4P0_CRYP1|nr:uncharacterized protein M406DRAFT_97590 [Cryphonectria parasitica EP155]KAF3766420.1 hypothetical protein M406DRAFT_97590 [Cryphonectria parasitica EP155]
MLRSHSSSAALGPIFLSRPDTLPSAPVTTNFLGAGARPTRRRGIRPLRPRCLGGPCYVLVAIAMSTLCNIVQACCAASRGCCWLGARIIASSIALPGYHVEALQRSKSGAGHASTPHRAFDK